MLQEDGDVISFHPGTGKVGQSALGRIVVHDRSKMESEVLPKYFNHSSFASLRRQLNYFAFTRVGKGRQRGATYCNEAVKELKDILRLKRRPVGSSTSTLPEECEDNVAKCSETNGQKGSSLQSMCDRTVTCSPTQAECPDKKCLLEPSKLQENERRRVTPAPEDEPTAEPAFGESLEFPRLNPQMFTLRNNVQTSRKHGLSAVPFLHVAGKKRRVHDQRSSKPTTLLHEAKTKNKRKKPSSSSYVEASHHQGLLPNVTLVSDTNGSNNNLSCGLRHPHVDGGVPVSLSFNVEGELSPDTGSSLLTKSLNVSAKSAQRIMLDLTTPSAASTGDTNNPCMTGSFPISTEAQDKVPCDVASDSVRLHTTEDVGTFFSQVPKNEQSLSDDQGQGYEDILAGCKALLALGNQAAGRARPVAFA